MKKQMRMFEDGGLEQDGGTVDPASGNKVPMGSAKNEVSDDVSARLSEGEFVFPADVVRYIGLEKLMVMRQKAKEGLQKMDAMGQMGNSDEATISDDTPFSEADLVMEDDDGNVVEMAEGGSVYNNYMGDAGIKQVSYVNTRTGDTTLVYLVNGQPIPALSSEWVPEGQAAPSAIEESIATNAVDTEQPEKDSRDQVSFFDGQPVSAGRSIKIRDADDWANLEGEGFLGKAVDQSKAPAGWNTQNQREYNELVKRNLPVEAMWNGNSWDVYTNDSRFKGTPYGAPGHRGFKPKYKDTLGALTSLNPFKSLKDKGKNFTDTMAKINQSYPDGLDGVLGETATHSSLVSSAGKGPGIKPRPITEKEEKDKGSPKTPFNPRSRTASDYRKKFKKADSAIKSSSTKPQSKPVFTDNTNKQTNAANASKAVVSGNKNLISAKHVPTENERKPITSGGRESYRKSEKYGGGRKHGGIASKKK